MPNRSAAFPAQSPEMVPTHFEMISRGGGVEPLIARVGPKLVPHDASNLITVLCAQFRHIEF